MNENSIKWEPWELTAYVLGDLEPEAKERIAALAASDAHVANEIRCIESTLSDVKYSLAAEQEEMAEDSMLARLAASSIQTVGTPANHRVVARSGLRSSFAKHRGRWIGSAVAASVLLMAGLAVLDQMGRDDRKGIALKDSEAGESAKSTDADSDGLGLSTTIRSSVTESSRVLRSSPQELADSASNTGSVPVPAFDALMAEKSGTVKRSEASRGISGGDSSSPPFDGQRAMQSSELSSRKAEGWDESQSQKTKVAPVETVMEGLASKPSSTPAPAGGSLGNQTGFDGGMGMTGFGGIEGGFPLSKDAGMNPANGGKEQAQVSGRLEKVRVDAREEQRDSKSHRFSVIPSSNNLADSPAPVAATTVPDFSTTPHPGPTGEGKFSNSAQVIGGEGGDYFFSDRDRLSLDTGLGLNLPRRNAPEGDRYSALVENDFVHVSKEPLSTFSIDVDTASYTKARQYLSEYHTLPPANAVRIEEFINYFDYEYDGPKDDKPFGSALTVTQCPWTPQHQLVRVALQAPKLDMSKRPNANIVFLLDVSGSMDEPNKLPLVKEAMRLLTYQLRENDRIAMVVYAGAAGCVLDGTRGDKQPEILAAIERLNAGGSTNGGQGIELAYRLARENFIPEGINRVILCTDGDFNVGVTSTEQLVGMVTENAKSKVFLTVMGFGMGNTNDAMLEQISDKGNGLYKFIDSRTEAQKQMVQQLAGNLMTVAKDVKIQVEFNPAKVKSYRLIGYENRKLAAEDFNNDKKDAGEIGAGHRVTALYEIIRADSVDSSEPGNVDPLRYQTSPKSEPAKVDGATSLPKEVGAHSEELLAVKLRYKQPEGDESKLLMLPLLDKVSAFSDSDRDLRWAASVAQFAMLLRGSAYKGNASWDGLLEMAKSAAGVEPEPLRAECLQLMEKARTLSRPTAASPK